MATIEAGAYMSTWKNLGERADSHRHVAQLYQPDELALAVNVGQYLWDGHNRGDGLLVIATPRNADSFRAELERRGANLNGLVQDGHLVFLDAGQTLARIMDGYTPDWSSFEQLVGGALRHVRPQTERSGLRVFGDMVGILWQARQFMAAVRLEQFWEQAFGALLVRQSVLRICDRRVQRGDCEPVDG